MAGVGLHQVFQYQPTWLTWHSWPYPTQKVHSSNLQYVYTYLVVILPTVNFLQQIKTKQIEARNGPFNENNLNILPLLAIGDKTTWDWFRIMETCPKVFNIVFNRAQHTHTTPPPWSDGTAVCPCFCQPVICCVYQFATSLPTFVSSFGHLALCFIIT